MSEGAVLTHADPQGGVHMVDVSDKPASVRTAVATGKVMVGETAFGLIQDGEVPKGDVMSLSQVAGIMGAKQTSKLIPLCHDVALKGIDVDLSLNEADFSVEIRAFAKSIGATGVEMEALTAVSIAALTVYDMCKSASKDIQITGIHLLAKTGGQSGDYLRS